MSATPNSPRTPSRICLFDKDGKLLHDADTPEAVAEIERLLDIGPTQ